MGRNIETLFNLDSAVTDEKIHAALTSQRRSMKLPSLRPLNDSSKFHHLPQLDQDKRATKESR